MYYNHNEVQWTVNLIIELNSQVRRQFLSISWSRINERLNNFRQSERKKKEFIKYLHQSASAAGLRYDPLHVRHDTIENLQDPNHTFKLSKDLRFDVWYVTTVTLIKMDEREGEQPVNSRDEKQSSVMFWVCIYLCVFWYVILKNDTRWPVITYCRTKYDRMKSVFDLQTCSRLSSLLLT